MKLDFEFFQSGPGGEMCWHLGLDISECKDWQQFTLAAVQYNDLSKGGLVRAARKFDGVASSGERPLLQAILMAADFAWLADELAAGEAWQRTESLGGQTRLTVAACLARYD